MPTDDGTSIGERDWILHSPYGEPSSHWALDEHGRATEDTTPGRRPSSTQLPVPTPRGDDTDWAPPDPDIEPHGTINRLRRSVLFGVPGLARCRTACSALVGVLVPRGAVMRPFWCQRDAVETLIWLLDAGRTHDPAAHAAICEQLAQVNSRWNAGIPRVAVKMATGTGKTNLMAMLGLWWTAKHPGRPVDFLVLTPGLTIRDRLQVLAKHRQRGLGVGCSSRLRPRRQAHPLDNPELPGFPASVNARGRRQDGLGERETVALRAGAESRPRLVARDRGRDARPLLKNHRAGGSLVVINDEAHHCYTLQGVALADGAVDPDEKDETKRAELWFGALRDTPRC